SIPERIALNQQLGSVLKKQMDEEMKIANQRLTVANARIKSEGRTKEALDAQADAMTEIADIQERITGQESEQLSNQNSLRKEADAKAVEIRQKSLDDAKEKIKLELDYFITTQGEK